MPIRAMSPSNKRMQAAGGTCLLAFLIALSLSVPLRAQPPTDQLDFYMRQQKAAMHPALEDELLNLTQSPRYTIDATFDPQARTVSGSLAVQVTNRSSAPWNEVVFRLYANANNIYNGRMRVLEIVNNLVPVEPVPSGDSTVLRIPLDRPLPPNRTTTIKMQFTTQIPTIRAAEYDILSQGQVTSLAGWYPILAPTLKTSG